jgi:hypothetical protein
MKKISGILIVLLLGACGSAPGVRMTSTFNGQSSSGTDFTDPHFYMDDDRAAPSFAAPSQNRGVDGICLSTCQSRSGSTAYCNRACGY